MMNQFPYYRYNNPFNRFNTYNPAFISNNITRRPLPNFNYNELNLKKESVSNNESINEEKEFSNNNDNLKNEDINIEKSDLNKENNKNNIKNSLKNNSFNFGPISLNNDRLSIFDFSIDIDDLLILGLILILLLDAKCNYALIIVLGLMFFNISFSSLNLF